ncbi:MAG: LeuA family protein [Vicinamibacterales bacterium]
MPQDANDEAAVPSSGAIFDWNAIDDHPATRPRVLLDDETLRDGLQSPSVSTPTIDQKLRILHVMHDLGIDCADIGLPGAGPHVARDVERLAREIGQARLSVKPNCAARTVVADIVPIARISQRVGMAIEVAAFIGSSPVRLYVEDWSTDYLVRCTEDAVAFAVGEGLPVVYVTEDTTRAHPDTLRRLYLAALGAGATRLCAADTVGHATPAGAAALVRFLRSLVTEHGSSAEIDWHGHRDRDLALVNTLAAVDAGATRVHATALGIGERAGNTPMDLLLVNLVLLGYLSRDLSRLRDYCELVSEACQVPIPVGYPVFGRDAFRTATGVHAAAVVKAFRKGDQQLADTVYSSVPARMVGREQEIGIGPMSGRSNVVYWLERQGVAVSEELVARIFAYAKSSAHVLTDEELRALVVGADRRRSDSSV